jgi:hypothetical protein
MKMSEKRYIVELNPEERAHLKSLINKGKAAARTLLKARILLKSDASSLGEDWPDERIATALETNTGMVYRTRRRLLEEGFAAVLSRKKRATPPVQPIFDGEAQARLIALACSTPPDGHGRWSIRLLAEKVVELEIVESVHFNTVGRALKKTISSHI